MPRPKYFYYCVANNDRLTDEGQFTPCETIGERTFRCPDCTGETRYRLVKDGFRKPAKVRK